MATVTYMKNNAGENEEGRTVETSAGAADASKIPNTNDNGVLDPTLLNAVAVSSGAPSAYAMVQLGATGQIDETMMPPGVVADTASIVATEDISAGAYVNTYNVSGVTKMRNADAATNRPARGFVLASVTNGTPGNVYFEGTNNQLSGRTPAAKQFLGAAGAVTETAPTAAGVTLQVIGYALSASAVNFQVNPPIKLA